MLDGIDLSQPHEVEQLRRSVAMLTPGVKVFDREEALLLLEALREAIKP